MFTTDQKRALDELKKHIDRPCCLKGSTNSGKTRVYLKLIDNEELYPAVISVPRYETVRSTLVQLKKWIDISDKVVVLPEGKERIREHCSTSCEECGKYRRRKLGKISGIYDADRIRNEYSDMCPYHTLLKLTAKADIVITVHDFLLANYDKLPSGKILVMDEIQQALSPMALKLLDFELSRGHLQNPELFHTLDRLRMIKEKIVNYLEDTSTQLTQNDAEFCVQLEMALGAVYNLSTNPITYESKRVAADSKLSIPHRLLTSDSEVEKAVNEAHKRMVQAIEIPLPSQRFRACLTDDEIWLLNRFIVIWDSEPELTCRKVYNSPSRDGLGYIEVYLVDKTYKRWEPVFEKFDTLLAASATPPNLDWTVVELERSDIVKPTIIYTESYDDAVEILRKGRNLLGITSGKRRAKKAIQKYGGYALHQEITVEDAELLAKTEKGLLVWDYLESPTSVGTNSLYFFDGFITYNPLNRDPVYEADKDAYIRKKAEDIYQHGSRVPRTVNGRRPKKFGLIDNKELFDALKEVATDWEFVKVANMVELQQIIEECEIMPAASDKVKAVVDKFFKQYKRPKICEKDINGRPYLTMNPIYASAEGLTDEEIQTVIELIKGRLRKV